MSEDKITKKQHYIPQVYLRGFSPQYQDKTLPNEKDTIYFYDLEKKKQSKIDVPIKSICYEEYLYEMRGDAGKFVCDNHLEGFFSRIENMFHTYRDKLERKAFLEENYNTKCFLTKNEKKFWKAYMIVQILRLPNGLDAVEQEIKKHMTYTSDNMLAHDAARWYCLPFFSEINEETGQIIKTLLKPMENMHIGVGVDLQGRIITSDNPVYVETSEWPCDEYNKIIFPISSQLCLFLFGKEEKKMVDENFLFPIGEADREEIIVSLASNAFKKIYLSYKLEEHEKENKYIEEAITNRRKEGEE